ncbi:electron transfer flavoprotein subunit alpha/FixB family protein [Bacteroidota bacterium]
MSILVYTENWDGKFKKLSFELVSYANKIAEMSGDSVVAVSIGNVAEEELNKLGNYGAAKVVNINDAKLANVDNQLYTAAISEVALKEDAKVLVIAHNNVGKALAPRLSVKLKAGLGSGVTKLPASVEPFTIYKKVFSGNGFSNVILKGDKKIITLMQNSYEINETGGSATIENFSPAISADAKTAVIDVDKQVGKIILTDAEIVVSGGRGLKSGDNWGPLVELAELLGAATACSRPVSDEGWRPHDEHTGQTGKIIAPNLYFALGISGAIQHLAGVSSSKVIVAVNKDNEAPIFEAADYGIIGDVQKVLPDMIEAVKELKAQ